MLGTLNQQVDHIDEVGQGEVDLDSLFKSFSCGFGLLGLLGPGQIDQIQLSNSEQTLASFVLIRRLDDNSEDGVTSRRVVVHLGCPDLPLGLAKVQLGQHLLGTGHIESL
jgi:hypothetical protein